VCSRDECVRAESATASAIIVYEQVGVCVALVSVPVCVWRGWGCVKSCNQRKNDLVLQRARERERLRENNFR